MKAPNPTHGTGPARSTFRNRIIQGEVQDENASVLGGVAGHAGLFSTAQIWQFSLRHAQGGPPILRPETIALFTRRESAPAGTSRALGWDTPSTPSQSGKYFGPSSFGHLGYTGTVLWIDPDRQLSITLLTNRTWPDCANQAIRQVRPTIPRRHRRSPDQNRKERRPKFKMIQLHHCKCSPDVIKWLCSRRTRKAHDLTRKPQSEIRSSPPHHGTDPARRHGSRPHVVPRNRPSHQSTRRDRSPPPSAALCPQIAHAIDVIVAGLRHGGRLIYVGAGTSGRLGALDASEIPPTFNTDPRTVQYIMAGGAEALASSTEASEDDTSSRLAEIKKRKPRKHDIVLGIATSGRTPFTIAAIEYARSRGARTIALTCNRNSPLERAADFAIVTEVGPEVLAGSSRMKAGTAHKMVLNMISTGAMTRLGYVYGNLMVNVWTKNEKLVQRAVRILEEATGADHDPPRAP